MSLRCRYYNAVPMHKTIILETGCLYMHNHLSTNGVMDRSDLLYFKKANGVFDLFQYFKMDPHCQGSPFATYCSRHRKGAPLGKTSTTPPVVGGLLMVSCLVGWPGMTGGSTVVHAGARPASGRPSSTRIGCSRFDAVVRCCCRFAR